MATPEAGGSTFTVFHEHDAGIYRLSICTQQGEELVTIKMPTEEAIQFAMVMVQTLMPDERTAA